MAEVAYFLINDSNIIISYQNEPIPAANIPAGYTQEQRTVEDPTSLVGQPYSLIDETPDKRPSLNELSTPDNQRRQLRELSIELGLMGRLNEDTTAKQAEFDALMNLYQNHST